MSGVDATARDVARAAHFDAGRLDAFLRGALPAVHGAMRLSLVIHVTGIVVRVFGLMFLAPLALALADRDFRDAQGFALSLAVTVAVGQLMRHAGGKAAEDHGQDTR